MSLVGRTTTNARGTHPTIGDRARRRSSNSAALAASDAALHAFTVTLRARVAVLPRGNGRPHPGDAAFLPGDIVFRPGDAVLPPSDAAFGGARPVVHDDEMRPSSPRAPSSPGRHPSSGRTARLVARRTPVVYRTTPMVAHDDARRPADEPRPSTGRHPSLLPTTPVVRATTPLVASNRARRPCKRRPPSLATAPTVRRTTPSLARAVPAVAEDGPRRPHQGHPSSLARLRLVPPESCRRPSKSRGAATKALSPPGEPRLRAARGWRRLSEGWLASRRTHRFHRSTGSGDSGVSSSAFSKRRSACSNAVTALCASLRLEVRLGRALPGDAHVVDALVLVLRAARRPPPPLRAGRPGRSRSGR